MRKGAHDFDSASLPAKTRLKIVQQLSTTTAREDVMTDQTTATAKPRPSRASRAADKLAAKPAPATEPTAEIVSGATGASTTGDNDHGHKRVAAAAAAKEIAAAKPAPASDQAAKPVKLTAAKAKKDTGPTKTTMNREIARRMVKACAELAGEVDRDPEGDGRAVHRQLAELRARARRRVGLASARPVSCRGSRSQEPVRWLVARAGPGNRAGRRNPRKGVRAN
jgi:hypothetical protein